MKTSYNWLKKYIDTTIDIDELVEKLTLLGLECSYRKLEKNFSNIIIGKIIDCQKHPDSNHLSICNVKIENKSIIQIICGAPNVKKNIFVPVAPIGSYLDNGDFKIKKVKLRGVESNGMICSEKELNIGENHEGIMILDVSDEDIGKSLEEILTIDNDYIIEFDITPNRGDCFSHLGIAREIAIIENKSIITSEYNFKTSNYKMSDMINVNLLDDNVCKRYSCRIIKNINVTNSPDWLRNAVESIGQKSINNIVDIANYIMFDTGQPLHAFDYDYISGKEINITSSKSNQKFVSINNVEYKLNDNDIVISDSDKPLAIAGIIGGLNSHVTKKTKNILIESAIFDDIKIRKSSKFHDISTESSKRFERGLDINVTTNILDKFVDMVLDISKGEVADDIIDIYPQKFNNRRIEFSLKLCNEFLGTDIKEKKIFDIFKKLNFVIEKYNDKLICITPSYRNDLTRSVDLYEEVARVFGYDKIPSLQSCRIPYNVLVKDDLSIENSFREFFVSNGFNEHYSNSLINEKDTKFSREYPIRLSNPLSKDMMFLRNSIIPGLLKALSYNERRKQNFVNLFEIGSIQYSKTNKNNLNSISENRFLGLGWLANDIQYWQGNLELDIYKVKGIVLELLNRYNIPDVELVESISTFSDLSIDIKINNQHIGNIYEINTQIKKDYNLKSKVFIVVINLDNHIQFINFDITKIDKPSQYPLINRDISILVDSKIKNIEIQKHIHEKGGELLKDVKLFDYYKGRDIDNDKVSLSYSLKFQSNDRTLEDKEIDLLINSILLFLEKQYKAIQR